jgi:hypothetical protein
MTEPALFVTKDERGAQCQEEACGFIANSLPEGYPELGHPIPTTYGKLGAFFEVGSFQHFEIVKTAHGAELNDWAIRLGETELGYFPESAWKDGEPPTYLTAEEVGGEVSVPYNPSLEKAQTTMGDGIAGTSADAAEWSGLQDVRNGTRGYVREFGQLGEVESGENYPSESEPTVYSGTWEEGPEGNRLRFGGPGWCRGSIGACPEEAGTGSASPVSGGYAILHGVVGPAGKKPSYYFHWGEESGSYPHETSLAGPVEGPTKKK